MNNQYKKIDNITNSLCTLNRSVMLHCKSDTMTMAEDVEELAYMIDSNLAELIDELAKIKDASKN